MVVDLPIRVADDHHRVCVLRIVALRAGEETASFGLYAEHVEKAARHHFTPNSRGVGGVAHGEYIPDPRRYEVDLLQIVAEITKVEIRRREGLAIGRPVLDGDDALWLRGAGQWIQQHGTHPTEDRGAGPNANANCQDCHHREARISSQCPQAVTKIAQQDAHRRWQKSASPWPFLSY